MTRKCIMETTRCKIAIATFTVAIFSASAGAADVTDGLIARWNMAQVVDGNTIVDASGNGRTLTFGPGCVLTNDVFGFKGALFFNGTSDAYASFPMPTVPDGNMTWSCWLWREVDDAPVKDGRQGQYLVAGNARYGTSFQLRLDNGDPGTLGVYYGRNASGAAYSFTTNNVVPRGTWTHYTFTFAMEPAAAEGWNGVDFNGTITCYANGVERFRKTQDYHAINMPAAQTMMVGNTKSDGTGVRPLYGALADFRVYNRALSAAEVAELCEANASSRLYPDGQVQYFPMENIVSDPAKYGGTNYVANAAANGTDGADLLLHKITAYSGDDAPRGGAITFTTDATDSSAAMFSKLLRLGDLTYSVWYKKGSPVAPNTYGPRFIVLNSVFYNIQLWENNFYYKWPASDGEIIGGRTTTPGWKHAVFTVSYNWDAEAGRWKAVMKVYEDGELMKTIEDIGGRDSITGIPSLLDVTIGNSGFINQARGYEGEMDEIRLFDRALGPDEVRELYKTGSVTFGVEEKSLRLLVKDTIPLGLKTYENGEPVESAVVGEWHVLEGDPSKVVFGDKTSSQSTVKLTDKGTYKVQFGACVGYGFVKSPVIELYGEPRGYAIMVR